MKIYTTHKRTLPSFIRAFFFRLSPNVFEFIRLYNLPLYTIFKPLFLMRIINKAVAKFSIHYQTVTVYNKPTNANFEISKVCNLICPLCKTGGLKGQFDYIERGLMNFQTFKTGMDMLLPQIESILLYIWGEPFLNRELYTCIEYAYKNKVLTQISTNMMLYNEEIGRKLIESGLSKIIISCDGLHQESYQKYRKGGDIDKVIQGVENLILLKKEYRVHHPILTMQFIVFKHNEKEMDEYKRFWESKGVNSVSFIRMSYMSKKGEEVSEELDLVPLNEMYQPYSYGNMKKCAELYNHITINWNGDWYTCCFPSGEEEFRIANINKDEFWNIWNGEKYKYYRKLLKEHTISQTAYHETMCHDCVGIYPTTATKRYWK